MTTSEQRAPGLRECVEAERIARSAVGEAKQYGLPADMLNDRLNTLTGARAATDEAVRAVEGALRAAFRLLTGGDALSDAEWRECTDTLAAYVRGGTTTGGASDASA